MFDDWNKKCLLRLQALERVHEKYESKGDGTYTLAIKREMEFWRRMIVIDDRRQT